MSIDLVAAAMWLDLPPARKLVLLALCERANGQSGECWPGRKEIAIRSSISVRSVTDQLKILEEDGWIKSVSRPNRAGQTTRRYVNVGKILGEADYYRERFKDQQVQDLHMQMDASGRGTPPHSNRHIEPSLN